MDNPQTHKTWDEDKPTRKYHTKQKTEKDEPHGNHQKQGGKSRGSQWESSSCYL